MNLLSAFLGFTFFCVGVLGKPQLTSSVASLSGTVCESDVTFFCNAINFTSGTLIEWYLDDQSIAMYVYRGNSQIPDVTVSSVLNATVKIISANLNGTLLNFNITLNINSSDLLQLQGKTLTCGGFAVRSNPYYINNFIIPNSNWQTSRSSVPCVSSTMTENEIDKTSNAPQLKGSSTVAISVSIVSVIFVVLIIMLVIIFIVRIKRKIKLCIYSTKTKEGTNTAIENYVTTVKTKENQAYGIVQQTTEPDNFMLATNFNQAYNAIKQSQREVDHENEYDFIHEV